MKKITDRYEFIWKAIQKHGYKYDYSKVNYINSKTNVCIICPIHGEFWQLPNNHLYGKQCAKCSKVHKPTTEEWIEKAKEVHNDKYDYSKVNYINAHAKICIICHEKDEDGVEHGEFWQTPDRHMNTKFGCPKCTTSGVRLTTEEFVKKANKIHNDKYDYSKVDYVNNRTKVCIICHEKDEDENEHGEFWQTPDNHLNGHSCGKCALNGVLLTTEEFVKKANKIHNGKYDYSKVNYINSKTNVCIICPIHGEFWQLPNNHLYGSKCPLCKESNLEIKVRLYLENNNIKYEKEKMFGWLKYISFLKLDFYLPDYNTAIECQGIQHFKPINFGGKNDESYNKLFKLNKVRDNVKQNLCKENNVKLTYINYFDNDDIINQKIKEIINERK